MLPSEADLVRIVTREARLIDKKRFADWYALYADDAFYWMPLTRGQPDGDDQASLMYEDKLLVQLRIERFSNPRSFSLHPEVRCLHVLQQPEGELRILLKRVDLLNCDAPLPSIPLFP